MQRTRVPTAGMKPIIHQVSKYSANCYPWPPAPCGREQRGPLPSIGVADALMDERRELIGS